MARLPLSGRLPSVLNLIDNQKIFLGNDDDFELYFDGTDLIITSSTGHIKVARPIEFSGGVAVTGADYMIARNADATNRLQLNVPTGASIEFSVNDSVVGLVLGSAFYANDFRNLTTGDNARVQLAAAGMTMSRNVADANACLIIEQQHASSTGDVTQWKNDSGTLMKLTQAGALEFAGADGGNGSACEFKLATTELTSVTGATATASNLIPAGGVVVAVTTRITTALGTSNGTTGYNIGEGVDADRWGAVSAVTAGTTSDNSNWTANTIQNFDSANDVILTAVGGNFDGTGAVRINLYYFTAVAPTS